MTLCHSCRLLLVAPPLSFPTSWSSSSAVSAGEIAWPVVVLFVLAEAPAVNVVLSGLVRLVDELLNVTPFHYFCNYNPFVTIVIIIVLVILISINAITIITIVLIIII